MGNDNGRGYYNVGIGNKKHRLNRLIYEHVYGLIPDGMVIDHINDIRNDNKISNLQQLTHSQNNIKVWKKRVRKLIPRIAKPVICWEKGTDETFEFLSMYNASKSLNMSVGVISKICSKIDNYGCKHAMNKENGKFYGFKLKPAECAVIGCV